METGQFDDAPDQGTVDQQQHLQAAQDQDTAQSQKQRRQEISDLLRPSSDVEDSEDDGVAHEYLIQEGDEDEDDYEDDMTGYGAVEDADWELARGDFTKQFNRSRQLASAITSASSSSTVSASAGKGSTTATPLPAMNRRRRPPPASSSSSKHPSTASGSAAAATAGPSTSKSHTASQMESLSKFASRVRVSDVYDPSSAIGGGVNSTVPRKALGGRDAVRIKDKADRATVEGVLDPRTMIILYKMVNRDLLESVNGCVSTGKEANVYHATTAADPAAQPPSNGEPPAKGSLALKIYKTSILVFKDRDRYVSGEFRFRHGYAKHNPRKMLQMKIHAAAAPAKEKDDGVKIGSSAPVQQKNVIGGNAWYTGLSNPSGAANGTVSTTGETEESLIQTLEQLMQQLSVEPEPSTNFNLNASANGQDAKPDTTKNDEEVFKATYIPFSLHEVDDPEREIELQKKKASTTTTTAAAAAASTTSSSAKPTNITVFESLM
ncbi:hypothetical protein NDA16_003894 [Ustilago loliicola]|nr:hypothetical protein NDA16_003894 [Ustilago loliicola]